MRKKGVGRGIGVVERDLDTDADEPHTEGLEDEADEPERGPCAAAPQHQVPWYLVSTVTSIILGCINISGLFRVGSIRVLNLICFHFSYTGNESSNEMLVSNDFTDG